MNVPSVAAEPVPDGGSVGRPSSPNHATPPSHAVPSRPSAPTATASGSKPAAISWGAATSPKSAPVSPSNWRTVSAPVANA